EIMLDFKAHVAPREANSYRENPPFLSTTASSPSYLHIDPTIPTSIESGGLPVSGVTITTDFDGDTRNATTPDIGADEFTGTPLPQCAGTPPTATIVGSNVCVGSGTTLTITGSTTDVGIEYQWKSSTVSGGPYTDIV